MKSKPQILIIHGGTPFETYDEYITYLKSAKLTLDKIMKEDWKDFLAEKVPEAQVIFPQMPNSKNARYFEWKIWFEKIIEFLENDVILIGHSLGGIFLAKYLSENNFPFYIKSLHLVAAPYDTEYVKASLVDFTLNSRVSTIENKVDKIFLYQSKDDTEVSYHDVEKYKRDMPKAEVIMFENRGHFQEQEFPELIENIKK